MNIKNQTLIPLQQKLDFKPENLQAQVCKSSKNANMFKLQNRKIDSQISQFQSNLIAIDKNRQKPKNPTNPLKPNSHNSSRNTANIPQIQGEYSQYSLVKNMQLQKQQSSKNTKKQPKKQSNFHMNTESPHNKLDINIMKYDLYKQNKPQIFNPILQKNEKLRSQSVQPKTQKQKSSHHYYDQLLCPLINQKQQQIHQMQTQKQEKRAKKQEKEKQEKNSENSQNHYEFHSQFVKKSQNTQKPQSQSQKQSHQNIKNTDQNPLNPYNKILTNINTNILPQSRQQNSRINISTTKNNNNNINNNNNSNNNSRNRTKSLQNSFNIMQKVDKSDQFLANMNFHQMHIMQQYNQIHNIQDLLGNACTKLDTKNQQNSVPLVRYSKNYSRINSPGQMSTEIRQSSCNQSQQSKYSQFKNEILRDANNIILNNNNNRETKEKQNIDTEISTDKEHIVIQNVSNFRPKKHLNQLNYSVDMAYYLKNHQQDQPNNKDYQSSVCQQNKGKVSVYSAKRKQRKPNNKEKQKINEKDHNLSDKGSISGWKIDQCSEQDLDSAIKRHTDFNELSSNNNGFYNCEYTSDNIQSKYQ